jgi:ADP-ribose pyrophosphatase YjhB (NUDIX family)
MNERPRDFFLSEGPLRPGDAAVALILLDDSRYLMQLRDQKPGIFYPGHWGLFGGGIEPGEAAEDGLRRELFEELGLEAESVSFFTRFSFDFSCCGARPVERHYYEVRVAAPKLRTMTLGEGTAMCAFTGQELLAKANVTPYDAFAIWMHLTRAVHLSKAAPAITG